jgi:hypothetical protein
VLYVRVDAPELNNAELKDNEFRLSPGSGDDDVRGRLVSMAGGRYETSVRLANLASSSTEWEVRVKLDDERGTKVETRVGITISGGEGNAGDAENPRERDRREGDNDTRVRIEGKARKVIDGFEAELNIRFESRPDRKKFQAEVENMNLPQGTSLAVCFQGQSLGVIQLNAFHFGELELDSRNGAAVPVFKPGDVVTVNQGSCGGSVVLSAAFSGTGVTVLDATPTRIEGKTRKVFEGFEAEFRIRFETRPDRRKFTAEVENLNLPQGTSLDVCFQGQSLGVIQLNAFHFGELELDSRNGATVAGFKSGDMVTVNQGGCAGTTVIAATFSTAGAAVFQGMIGRIEGRSRKVINGFEAELNIRFELRPDRRKFRAEVENLNLPEGTVLTICFQGQSLGSIRLDAFHFGELELDSRRGETVPDFKRGDEISVIQGSCTGTPLLSATFEEGIDRRRVRSEMQSRRGRDR